MNVLLASTNYLPSCFPRSNSQTNNSTHGTRSLPYRLPPLFLGRRVRGNQIHLPANVVDVPSGERCEIARFFFLAIAQRCPVSLGSFAIGAAGPRMTQDVACLEVLSVAGFLEDEILGEMLAVVAHVQPGQKNFGGATAVGIIRDPESAEAAQLLA